MTIKDAIRNASYEQILIFIALGAVIGLLMSRIWFGNPVAAVAEEQEAGAAAFVGRNGFVLVDPETGKIIPPCKGNDQAGSTVDRACGYSIKLNDDVESLLRIVTTLIKSSPPVITGPDGMQRTVMSQDLIYQTRFQGSHCELWYPVVSGGSATFVCIRYGRH